MKLGEFIRMRREKLSLPVRELGKLVNVSGPYISMIENDKIDSVPSEMLIRKLSIELGLTASENELLYELYDNDVKEKLNRKISSLRKNMKSSGNYGVIVGKVEGDLKCKQVVTESDDVIDLSKFSAEDREKIIEFVEFIKFKNK